MHTTMRTPAAGTLLGSGARLQMQKLIDGPVYLELFVKVVPHWRQKPGRLAELGYRGE